jgi:hypothetical protein
MKYFLKYFVIIALFFIFFSCRNPSMMSAKNQENISIHNLFVTGLSTSEKITITSSSGQWIDVNSNGQLVLSGTSFPTEIAGMPEIVDQPKGKTCSILPEILEKTASDNVRWTLTCSPINYFSVGGVVTGLSGTHVKLQLNNFIPVVVSQNGTFKFNQILAEKTAYEIKVVGYPHNPDQLCTVNHGRGMIDKPLNDIEVACSSNVYLLSGSITGQKSGLTLVNSNGDSLYINRNDSRFEFSRFIPAGASYSLEVQTQPYGQECYIINSRDVKIKHNISNVRVVCNDVKDMPVSLIISENDKSLIGADKYVHLWFYLDSRQVVYPTFTKSAVYTPGSSFHFNVPKGSWYVRAFIDIDADQKPGIGADFQSRLTKWTSDYDSLVISLENTFHDSGFQTFNAYVFNTSEWYQPHGGKCGGVYLRLESINFKGNKNHISPVYVILPDNKTIELLDDGGCGDSFNNNAASYDKQSGDGRLSAGIDQSLGIQSGTYTFYYVNYMTDKIHIVEDSITNVTPLSSFIHLVYPTGATPVQTPNPVFQWNAVAGAVSYEILIESTDHAINNYFDPQRFVKTNVYVAPFSLPDQKAFKVNIQAFDADIAKNSDRNFNAVSQSPDQYFITDFTGTNSVSVGGKLSNLSGSTGSYLIYADSNVETGSWESSVFLPPESNVYSLSIFKNSGKYGALISGINIDENGYIFSNVNRVYARWSHSLYFNGNLVLDLTWNKPLLLHEPVANERGMGEYPVFSWEDYSKNTPSPWSYILWVAPVNSHGIPRLIGLENNRFDFSRLNQGSYFNLTPLYLCTLKNKSNEEINKQILSTCGYNEENVQPDGLKEQTDWEWKVMVVPCNFQEYKNATDADRNGRSGYIDCLLKTFSGEKSPITESVSNVFSTY